MKISIALLCMGAFLGGCHYLNQKAGLDDDNILEEFIEHQIKENTGVDFDLTPDSKEEFWSVKIGKF